MGKIGKADRHVKQFQERQQMLNIMKPCNPGGFGEGVEKLLKLSKYFERQSKFTNIIMKNIK